MCTVLGRLEPNSRVGQEIGEGVAKRALFVGIDEYRYRDKLHNCADDAKAVAASLRWNADGLRNWWPATVLSSGPGQQIGSKQLEESLQKLFAQKADSVLFYFAGHADPTEDGLLLAASDDLPPGASQSNGDQSGSDCRRGVLVRDILSQFAASGSLSMTMILDCCHSGLAADEDTPPNVCILAGAGADQAAAEFGRHGGFTGHLLKGLSGAAADSRGQITALTLFSYASSLMDFLGEQQPVLTAHLNRLSVIKTVKTTIGQQDAEEFIGRRFNSDGSKLQLSPEHEAPKGTPLPADIRSRHPDMKPSERTPLQEEMDILKQLRDANLIEVCGGRDLFWACMESGEVQLTELGKHFWAMAHQN